MSGASADIIKRAIECVASGDTSQALEIVKEWIASAAGVDADTPDPEENAAADPTDEGDADGSEGDGAEGIPPIKKAKNRTASPKVESNGLTSMQNKICREKGISPETFLAAKQALNPSIKRLQAAVHGGGQPMAIHGAFAGGGGSDGTTRGGFKPSR